MTQFTVAKTFVPLSDCGSHTHGGWEIILNLSGRGENVFDERTSPFYPGLITCVPPRMAHAKICRGTFKDIYITTNQKNLFPGSAVITTTDDEFKSIEKIMEMIHYAYFRDNGLVSAGTAELCAALVQLIKERTRQPPVNPYAERIRRVIIQRFSDPELSITSAMEGLPYSVDYLRRLFMREFGVTPQQYLIQLRMERARQILRQPGLSVTEAALSCGFYDARYFSRLFRREVGVTPSEYARHPSSFLST